MAARNHRENNNKHDYTGYLEDGQLFDTSLESEAKIFEYWTLRAAQNGYQPMCFKQDERMV
jgi:peptidylprolyl isomerase